MIWDRAEWISPLTRGIRHIEAAFSAKPGRRSFGSPKIISDPATDAFDPNIALDRRGTALALWTRGDFYDYNQPRSVQFAIGRP